MAFSAQGILSDSQITLEKAATDKFGSVVEDFTKGKFGRADAITTDATGNLVDDTKRTEAGNWYATSYAAALAGGTTYRPKLKFLFKVRFNFNQEARTKFIASLPEVSRLAFASLDKNEFTFMIKMVDRPKIDFEYEEDVNMYNFRTKVLKKIRHRDLTIVFMDDTGNRVFDFYRLLMMMNSPITVRQLHRDGTLQKPSPSLEAGSSGMQFSGADNAHRGVVNSQYGNVIDSIQVQQIFVDPSGQLETAVQMTSFDFMNPRIVSFDFDELSHEANDVSLLTMVFDYDWLEMVKIGALGKKDTAYGPDERQSVVAPGVHGAPSDISPNKASGATGSAGGAGSALGGAISSILGRGAANLTQDTIAKYVKTVAGSGTLSTALGGIVGSSAGNIAGAFTSSGARDLFSNIGRAPSTVSADTAVPTPGASNTVSSTGNT